MGALSAFGMALCYISMFIIFGALLSFPNTDDLGTKIQYIAEHRTLISLSYFIGYLLFGCLLLVSIQAIHNRMNMRSSSLLNSASLFGLVWVVLMMCSGMIAMIAMDKMIKLHAEGSIHAESLFMSYATLVDALGGGIELVGGLWVLLLSIVGLRDKHLSKGLNLLGIWVGLFGVLTLFHTISELKEVFGLSQIAWFIWMALVLRKTPL